MCMKLNFIIEFFSTEYFPRKISAEEKIYFVLRDPLLGVFTFDIKMKEKTGLRIYCVDIKAFIAEKIIPKTTKLIKSLLFQKYTIRKLDLSFQQLNI